MVRNLSPLVQQELENLDKDAESRRSAMKALKSYATNMDSKAIPQFLAQVSETNSHGSPSGECSISLFEVLARVHGRSIVPQIESIMTTIIRTLSTSAGSFPLHQACSKVVPAIARYGIDPSTPDDDKKKIIFSLYKPLTESLMSSPECLASGAALCLKALVESNNWKCASDDMVNDVCLKATVALGEKKTQSNSHMGLAMALAKHNCSIAEAYVGSLIRSGLHILTSGSIEKNSQKRFFAIQMINFLMKCIDSRNFSLELDDVVDAMEKCQNDQMPYVRGAAFEAFQTAKGVVASYHDLDRRVERIPQVEFPTPESIVVTSSINCEARTETPNSVSLSSPNGEHLSRRAHRRLWKNNFGGVDLSCNDSFFIKACSSSNITEAELRKLNCDENYENEGTDTEFSESFLGFVPSSVGSTSRDSTPSPQRSRKGLSIDDIRIYTTPRKLIRSLQNQIDCTSRDKTTDEAMEPNGEDHSHSTDVDTKFEFKEVSHLRKRKSTASSVEQVHQSIDSVSSYDPLDRHGSRMVSKPTIENLQGTEINNVKTAWYVKSVVALVFGLVVMNFVIIMLIVRNYDDDDDDERCFCLVPT
ncbi:hypothetical protein AXF42_Ash010179 [Apostasia shenzhenica]|uniref:TORTIFOLIA1/SINE1-2 N-terminal domain-containing protein n=1 Tax=Apostasia shenzhenica TaxID=1088818 RepID=A0A2I0A9P0_9ASPA|nr:hypothetical protein AXF42_Ash010179 [Apostasia shenzhenica]